MDLLDVLAEPAVSVVAACAAFGVCLATLYRASAPPAGARQAPP